jgi:electron transport complex protein RnfB
LIQACCKKYLALNIIINKLDTPLNYNMQEDIYVKFADYLDQLPAGFPRTESGVELRILQQLFTPEEAVLAMHLTLIAEEPAVVAYRAGIEVGEAEKKLEEMDRRGLIYSTQVKDKTIKYCIQQYIIGFWEGQVDRLTPQLVRDFEEYLPLFIDLDLWQKVPQLRTIPVEQSIDTSTFILPYEHIREMVSKHKEFTVSNCICRQEQRMLGNGCDKPEETCLTFGVGAEHNKRINKGRLISRNEVFDILHKAEDFGLVLQAANARDIYYICACCGCCCGALRSVKEDPRPASRVSSPFRAILNTDICSGCGTCIDRCQMDALMLNNDIAVINQDRCIGCGLCITTCTTGALRLQRKPESEQYYIPASLQEAYIKLGQARGKMSLQYLAGLKFRSLKDRVLSKFN